MSGTVTVTLSEALRHAYSAYKAGKLDVAERLCLQVVDANGGLFSAYHLLGIVQSARGEKLTALASFDRAIALRPDYVEALTNRGNTLHELQRFDEALANYDRALAVRPDSVVVLYNRGNTLHALKRFEEALASHDRALALQPDHPQALSNRGATLCMLKRYEEALESYDRALIVRPDHAELLSNRANTLCEIRRFEEAVAGYDRALALRPNHAEALSNRGTALRELKRFEDSLASHDRALALRPENVVTLSNRGLTLHDMGRFDEALASYDRALSLQPDDYAALINRGNTLRHLKRIDEALASYDRALSLQPGEFAALINRGNTLHQVKRIDEALVSYGRALVVRPDNGEAQFNAALCRLLLGDFERGFADYESRWHSPARAKDRRDFPQTLWLGAEEVAGKIVLLHAEQGLGDTFQFCRYVPLVAARAGRVIFEAPKSLLELMRSLPGAFEIVAKGDELPVFDLHSPLLSLPLALGTRLETIPSVTPYLHASPQSVTEWKIRLGSKHRPRIGLAWSGSPSHKSDRTRSIALNTLLPLLSIDATFVSLQKDVRAGDVEVLRDHSELLHFGDALTDFSDTAGLIANLDLVISVDTAVAHLAGALAKPVWVLLPFAPDWRWLLDREDSPWYPTAHLFRQSESRAWPDVIARVHAALDGFLAGSPQRI